MVKKISLMLLAFIVLSGCSTGSKEFKVQMNAIEQQLISEDWEALSPQLNTLVEAYDKNKWKIQLLGDEGEYERLYESINRLRAAVDSKDAESASLELATLKTIVQDIYSL